MNSERKRGKLAIVNNILFCLILLINLYIVVSPLLPAIGFWWQSHHTNRKQDLIVQIQQSKKSAKTLPAQPNHLVIPSMLLDQPILEGPVSKQYDTLDKGIWRWPKGSSPDKGGNTTLIGHRFTYTNPRGVFYFLNKVKTGDEIGLTWANRSYLYHVTSTTVVPPNDTSIENNTSDARLTLFTCTPLWLPKNRLVVIAELEKKS